MERDLLRLALVNHALHFDVDHHSAWALADDVLQDAGETPVRELADRVRLAATQQVYGPEFVQRSMPPTTQD